VARSHYQQQQDQQEQQQQQQQQQHMELQRQLRQHVQNLNCDLTVVDRFWRGHDSPGCKYWSGAAGSCGYGQQCRDRYSHVVGQPTGACCLPVL
jgi:hypothetical protein